MESSAGLELMSVYGDHEIGRTRQDRLVIWADRIEDHSLEENVWIVVRSSRRQDLPG